MTKSSIVKEISKNTNLTQKECRLCLDSFIDIVNESLKKGDIVTINGFGKFNVKTRKSHMGFNPRTREKIVVPNKNVVDFKYYNEIEK